MKWLPVLALLASGCLFDDLSYEGMSCPCPDSWSCDKVTNRCTRASSSGGSCTPLLPVSGFRADWRTPNAIRWKWDEPPLDWQSDFGAYELVVGEDVEAVATADESRGARIFTVEQNPELGGFTYNRIDEIHIVQSTATDGLEPNTTYHGMLVAKDAATCAFRSQVVEARTTEPIGGKIELFIDRLEAGVSLQDLAEADDCGADPDGMPGSGPCLQCTHPVCTAGPDGGTVKGLVVKVDFAPSATAFGEGLFGEAYVEFKLAFDAPQDAYYANYWIRAADLVMYQTLAMSWRAGGAYRTYQVPLSVLNIKDQEELIEYADTTAGFNQIALWAEWAGATFVRVDDVAIRW